MRRSVHRDWDGKPVVYRHFDRDGRLLYIGSTRRMSRRWAEHRAEAWWFELVAKTRVQVFPTPGAAAAAERVAIQEEQPLFNTWWTGRPYPCTDGWTKSDLSLFRRKRGRWAAEFAMKAALR